MEDELDDFISIIRKDFLSLKIIPGGQSSGTARSSDSPEENIVIE